MCRFLSSLSFEAKFLLIIILFILVRYGDGKIEEAFVKHETFAYCQRSIQEELKSPASAAFHFDFDDLNFEGIPAYTVKKLTYVVSVNGWVASQNLSGDTIKQIYRCTVSKEPNSNSWELLELQIPVSKKEKNHLELDSKDEE